MGGGGAEQGDGGGDDSDEEELAAQKGADTFLTHLGIKKEGATAMAHALREHEKLRCLVLSYNAIGDRGSSQLASAITGNTVLTALDIGFNDIGEEGATKWADIIESQKTGKSDIEWALTSVLMMGNQDIPSEVRHRLHNLSTGTLLAVEM